MNLDLLTLLLIALLILLVAALYSSVGHGGASGYLAILSFFAFSPAVISSTALVLNVLVASIGLLTFLRAKHFSWALAWPFMILSVPFALIGGLLVVSSRLYCLLLAAVLVVAAYRMATARKERETEEPVAAPVPTIAMPVGAGIGLLSGIVGVGGGIFLSPLLIVLRWASAKQTAAVSAFFILVNSIAGLSGRMMRGGIELGQLVPLIAAAFVGGYLGSYYGANRFSGIMLRRALALVLLIASFKLLSQSLP